MNAASSEHKGRGEGREKMGGDARWPEWRDPRACGAAGDDSNNGGSFGRMESHRKIVKGSLILGRGFFLVFNLKCKQVFKRRGGSDQTRKPGGEEIRRSGEKIFKHKILQQTSGKNIKTVCQVRPEGDRPVGRI